MLQLEIFVVKAAICQECARSIIEADNAALALLLSACLFSEQI
jgi:hypothetical protein